MRGSEGSPAHGPPTDAAYANADVALAESPSRVDGSKRPPADAATIASVVEQAVAAAIALATRRSQRSTRGARSDPPECIRPGTAELHGNRQ